MTLPEAMFTVAENKNGWRSMTWMEYIEAVSIVDEAFPVTGYNLVEDDGESEVEQVSWRKFQNDIYSQKCAERTGI